MDTVLLLQNQIIIMRGLLCMNELPINVIQQIREQIVFTEARIIALS